MESADMRRHSGWRLAYAPVSNYHQKKAIFDQCIAAALLIAFLPLILALMSLVRATSTGAAIYTQTRVGRNGKTFRIYKLRTMYQDAEKLSGPVWAVRGDSRVSPVGRVLRFLHLDELPQLINVIRGDMSLVGPRPERPEFVERLKQQVPRYTERLAVLPGITGLAQINLPPDEGLDCVRRKVIVDCEYVAKATLLLDLRILLCTGLRMVGVRHGRAARWLRIDYRFEEALDHPSHSSVWCGAPLAQQAESSGHGSRRRSTHAAPNSPQFVLAATSTSSDFGSSVLDAAPRQPR